MKKLILGLGVSGRSVLRYLRECNCQVIGIDKRAREFENDPFFANIPLYSEEQTIVYSEISAIVKSPGIAWGHPVLKEAIARNIPITSEMEIACQALQKRKKTLFAITGSNGKTTTTLLTTHLLIQNGLKAVAVGNVGRPLLSEIDSDHDFFIVELSSFHLETLHLPLFDAACLLNISNNHLDRYDSLEHYAKTKFQMLRCLKKEAKLFLREGVIKEFGYLIDSDYKEKVATIPPLSYRDRQLLIANHDLENLQAASLLAAVAGIKEEECWKAFLSFQKPPHRIEFVRELQGVTYINDSKATSADAVLKALEAVTGRVILIAGGLDKKGDFSALTKILGQKVKKLLLIGTSAQKIQNELHDCVGIEMVGTLESAVKRASALASHGESVLFSPGCASYDQFRNYEHRGDVFKQLVIELGEKYES